MSLMTPRDITRITTAVCDWLGSWHAALKGQRPDPYQQPTHISAFCLPSKSKILRQYDFAAVGLHERQPQKSLATASEMARGPPKAAKS
eukprot:614497-Amphidinium_carterae.3